MEQIIREDCCQSSHLCRRIGPRSCHGLAFCLYQRHRPSWSSVSQRKFAQTDHTGQSQKNACPSDPRAQRPSHPRIVGEKIVRLAFEGRIPGAIQDLRRSLTRSEPVIAEDNVRMAGGEPLIHQEALRSELIFILLYSSSIN